MVIGTRGLVVRAWRLAIRPAVLAGFSILVLPVAALPVAALSVAALPELLLCRTLRSVGRGEPGRFKARWRGSVTAFGFRLVGRLVSHVSPWEFCFPAYRRRRVTAPSTAARTRQK